MVGTCYLNGNGIFKDENKSFEWYLKAAKNGHNYSQTKVAEYYNDGKIVQKNEEKWIYWIRKAAINGNISAQYKLAEYYLNNFTNENGKKAFKWYLKLSSGSNIFGKRTKAYYQLAKCYKDGIGTDKNLDKAEKWLNNIIINQFL